jgi:hypothetical protein
MKSMILFIASALLSSRAVAQVTAITNEAQWQNAVGSYTTLDFTSYPEFTIITDQYVNQGVEFTDGNDFIFTTGSFPSDGHGLVSSDGFGSLGMIHMSFSQPQYWLAFDFIGHLQIELYNDGDLIFTSSEYVAGFTPFVGLVSTMSFDAAVARSFSHPTISIDNMHFGPPVPAPGALALICLCAATAAGRRNRRCDS